MRVQLFTTMGCHLCDEALALLEALIDSGFDMQVEEVDIADSETLMEQYGIRIPVIRVIDQDDELDWPFDIQRLQMFLLMQEDRTP